MQGAETFDSLYESFDELLDFFDKNPIWAHKLNYAQDRFIHSSDRNYYSTDFFGLYDESKKGARGQISFYYSIHFHAFISNRFPEFNKAPVVIRFFEACQKIQKPHGILFHETATQLGIGAIFSSQYGEPPILLKVVKYLPSYIATRPHYDGTAFSLLLDSTNNESLLLSPYNSSLIAEDFFSPTRKYPRARNQNSMLLIPGAFLSEFFIDPTPHIVLQSGKTRYATIAFAMRPNYAAQKNQYAPLPNFKH